MYKCKHCGVEFENKGAELEHYKEFKEGACATVLAEGVPADQKIHATEQEAAVEVHDQNLEAQVSGMGKKHAEELRKNHPQIKVVIPVDKLNRHDTEAIACTQGYIWQVQRGKPVYLPEPVVELFEEGGYQPTRVK